MYEINENFGFQFNLQSSVPFFLVDYRYKVAGQGVSKISRVTS